ncbi:MAG: hypothetical protein PHI31_08780 [Desulfuromonadaceae bacterium]|nr:hypothetical protein [Desulfuromonadaceae bacterium]
MITAITSCIKDGIITKMELATHAAERAKCSRKHALRIVEKYSGNDPAIHLWLYVVRGRGAKVFQLLQEQKSMTAQ